MANSSRKHNGTEEIGQSMHRLCTRVYVFIMSFEIVTYSK